MEHISKFGKLIPIEGTEFMVHPEISKQGGISLRDYDNIIPSAFKNIAAKLSKNLLKGKVADIKHTATPAYLHQSFSHLGLMRNDFTFG